MARHTMSRHRGDGLSPLVAGAVVAGVLGFSAWLGRRNAPEPGHPRIDRWYHGLDKPAFTPPDPVFAAVWPAIEVAMGIGGYRLLRAPPSPARDAAALLWLGNSAMIGGWTEIFFRRRALGAGTAASAAMLATGTAYAITAAKVDRPAAATAVPFVAWLGFATLLAGSVWRRNPDQA